jgi:hypothetical protein
MSRRVGGSGERVLLVFTFEFEPAGADVVMHISVPSDRGEVLDALDNISTSANTNSP